MDRRQAIALLHDRVTVVVAEVVEPGLRGGDPEAAGRTAWARLAAVADAAAAAGRVPVRGLRTVAYHAIEGACLRLLRGGGVEGGSAAVERLLAATGFAVRRPSRPLKVRVDAGSAVELSVPGICCALLRVADADACPMCPQHPSDHTRDRLTREWIGSLDDDEFRQVCGRARWPDVVR